MSIFRNDQNEVHSLHGNHIAGLATPASGARQVEMWRGRMEAQSASPPHRHDTEEVVLFLKGSGRATISDREVRFQAGDTVMLPAGELHQLFADTECEFVAAMPIGGTVRLPDDVVMDLPWRR